MNINTSRFQWDLACPAYAGVRDTRLLAQIWAIVVLLINGAAAYTIWVQTPDIPMTLGRQIVGTTWACFVIWYAFRLLLSREILHKALVCDASGVSFEYLLSRHVGAAWHVKTRYAPWKQVEIRAFSGTDSEGGEHHYVVVGFLSRSGASEVFGLECSDNKTAENQAALILSCNPQLASEKSFNTAFQPQPDMTRVPRKA